MQIQVMSGSSTDEASDLIGFVIAALKENIYGYPIVDANAYATDGMLAILEVRAARGEREILVVECSRAQIRAVLEWQSETEDNVDLKDLVIHLVRKQEEQNHA
jgi:hypothetical protein